MSFLALVLKHLILLTLLDKSLSEGEGIPTEWNGWWGSFERLLYENELFNSTLRQHLLATDQVGYKAKVTGFLSDVAPFLTHGIAVPLNNTTRPYKLTEDCRHENFAHLFSGARREKPARIVMAIQFSAELHLLRLRYHMYHDLVDIFIVAEGMYGHQTYIRKPLIFERNKQHFLGFLHKTVHLVFDDRWYTKLANHYTGDKADFTGELKERHFVHHFMKENRLELADDDIFIYGDADEFADEEFLSLLKHCQLQNISTPFSSNAPLFVNDLR